MRPSGQDRRRWTGWAIKRVDGHFLSHDGPSRLGDAAVYPTLQHAFDICREWQDIEYDVAPSLVELDDHGTPFRELHQ